jgi:hypothetical protein
MVLSTLIRWAGEYNECRARQNDLVDVIRQTEKEKAP